MKRKWIMAAGLCAFVTIADIGCGAKGEEPQIVTVEEINPPETEQTQDDEISQSDESTKENRQSQDDEQVNADEQVKDSDLTDSPGSEKDTEKLEGNVKSIGDSSAVIIKAIIKEMENGSVIMVGSASGYESEEDLVNVSFKVTTEYELRIVKNGGINPDEDVSIKEAAFSDIKENASISLEGYYEGDAFIAEKVVLYEFV